MTLPIKPDLLEGDIEDLENEINNLAKAGLDCESAEKSRQLGYYKELQQWRMRSLQHINCLSCHEEPIGLKLNCSQKIILDLNEWKLAGAKGK